MVKIQLKPSFLDPGPMLRAAGLLYLKKMTKFVNSSKAYIALESGKLIRHKSWEKDFMFKRPQITIPAEIVLKANTIPENVKKYLRGDVIASQYFCTYRHSSNTIVNGTSIYNYVEHPAEYVWEILND
jgi:hypothetical protein